jgi:hypothetical protein
MVLCGTISFGDLTFLGNLLAVQGTRQVNLAVVVHLWKVCRKFFVGINFIYEPFF